LLLLRIALFRCLLLAVLGEVSYTLNLFLAHYLLERTESRQLKTVFLSQPADLSDFIRLEFLAQ